MQAERRGLYAAFASLGVTAALVPAVLPMAERSVGEDLSGAVPVLFSGVLFGVLAVGPLRRALTLRSAIMIGCALQSIAIAGLVLGTVPGVFLGAAAIAGIGFGLVEAAGSIAAKHASQGSTTGLLSTLTGTVAICAAATPLVAAAASAAPTALCALAAIPMTATVLVRNAGEPPATSTVRIRAFGSLWKVIPYASALPLYVGVETVLSGWSATIPQRALDVGPGIAAIGTSVFWILMAIGRFAAAELRRRGMRPSSILAFGAAVATLCLLCAGLLISPQPAWALVSISVAVIALAPSYGLILGLALDRLDAPQGRAVTGMLVACGSLGGTLIPASVLIIGRDPASAFTFVTSAALCAAIPALTTWGGARGVNEQTPVAAAP